MASKTSGADFQVFLSFRGPDTRLGFADCLYHFLVDAGVRVFRDNEEVRPGEKIEVILRAINSSTVCIPIFSKGYASSKWCLLELTKMVELKKTIMPVFYDVTPDDVKLKTPLYRDALTKHGGGVDEKWQMALKDVVEVSGWKSNDRAEQEQALKQVVKVKGWELKGKGHGELCKSIVGEVLENLKVRTKVVSDCLVGIEDKVESVVKLLDMDSSGSGARYILIHGIGGGGKTTLAKIVFNRLNSRFEYCSFLLNVRELSERHGVEYLQKQLISDPGQRSTAVPNSDAGVTALRDILTNKKALIVLDDVDKREQIEKLIPDSSLIASKSRIIITTRDVRVLESGHEVKRGALFKYPREVETFKMEQLDSSQALELLSVHAFGFNFPPSEYLELSKKVLSLSSHLPLYLEVAGSSLRGKSKEEWSSYIKALQKIPEKNVQEKLMMSYNGLDARTKQIFLDIACFFVNKDKTAAIYMWEACGFHPNIGLAVLTSLSLVKIIDEHKLWMHDTLRDLGREIVCQENLIDSGKRSRLWIHEEALGILDRSEGTRKVQALYLPENESSKCFTRENFQNLINLRILDWNGSHFKGEFKHLFSKLRWLSWHQCPPNSKVANLNLENLVVLALSESDITEEWRGWSQTNMGAHLKVLDLTGCKYLERTPDLSKFSALERLILNDCVNLIELDPSIGKVKSLKHLHLKECDSLCGLPKELGSLVALEEILFNPLFSDNSFSLPDSIENLQSLRVLEILWRELVRDFYSFPLPSICKLKKLEKLALTGCVGIEELPESFGDLESLVELDLSFCADFCRLSDSIGNLKQLKVLNVSGTFLSELPHSIGKLELLEELRAAGASELTVVLPNEIEIEGLSCLKFLDLSDTAIQVLPSLSNLSQLQTLRLLHCDSLQVVPELPTSLIDLEVSSKSVHKTSVFSRLNSLVELKWECPNSQSITISQMNCTPHLLSRLTLSYLHREKNIFDLSPLQNLSYLRLEHCTLNEHVQCLRVGDLKSLKHFELYDCDVGDLNTILPKTLEKLVVGECDSLTLLDLSHLQNLEELRICGCKLLKQIRGLGELKSLQRFAIDRCPALPQIMHPLLERDLLAFHNHKKNKKKEKTRFPWIR